tara:strand:+ start:5336 stop:6283 length:948 start_codon:yes stop_codon:yes gene_type:complete
MDLNTEQFWDLNRDYYISIPGNAWDTYEKFINGIRTSPIVDGFAFKSPFNYVPSYGSTMTVSMVNDTIRFGDGYQSISPGMMNKYSIVAVLPFTDRGDEETESIVNYIKENGSHRYFPYQQTTWESLPMDSIAGEGYKSLYSIPPYFVHEFRCLDLSITKGHSGRNSISLVLENTIFSDFTIRNLINLPSLPAATRAIINTAANSDVLDEKPSLAVPSTVTMSTSAFGGVSARTHHEKNGINNIKHSYELTFENINDTKLLKLISFILNKGGSGKFKFTSPEPFSETKNYVCQGFRHIYVFKGIHSFEISIIEVV